VNIIKQARQLFFLNRQKMGYTTENYHAGQNKR